MTHKEFLRLRSFDLAKKRAPYTNTISRRTAKSKSTGVGQHLKRGRITHEVSLEKQFNTARTLVWQL